MLTCKIALPDWSHRIIVNKNPGFHALYLAGWNEFLGVGFCSKNLAFAWKMMALPDSVGCSPQAPWLICLWATAGLHVVIIMGLLLQVCHWIHILKAAWLTEGLFNKLSVFVKGPGWAPGKPRLGFVEDIPNVGIYFVTIASRLLWQLLTSCTHLPVTVVVVVVVVVVTVVVIFSAY